MRLVYFKKNLKGLTESLNYYQKPYSVELTVGCDNLEVIHSSKNLKALF